MCSGVCPGVCRAVMNGAAERESVAVLHLLGVEAVTRPAFVAGEDLRRIDPRAKFACAAHQIGVNVRLEDVRDREIILARHLQVFVHIGRRIKDGRHALAVVAHEVGKLGNAVGLDAFEDE